MQVCVCVSASVCVCVCEFNKCVQGKGAHRENGSSELTCWLLANVRVWIKAVHRDPRTTAQTLGRNHTSVWASESVVHPVLVCQDGGVVNPAEAVICWLIVQANVGVGHIRVLLDNVAHIHGVVHVFDGHKVPAAILTLKPGVVGRVLTVVVVVQAVLATEQPALLAEATLLLSRVNGSAKWR